MAKPLTVSTIRKAAKAPPPPPPPVMSGQTVWLSVLPKPDIAGNVSDCSPKVFATEAAAQADCNQLNKTRAGYKFVVREMQVY